MRALCCGVAVRKAGMKVGAGSAALRSITHPAFEGICAKSRAAPPSTLRWGFSMRCFILTLLLCVSTTGHAQDFCQTISGASVIADDEKFLGKIASQYSSDSIFNEYGTHGSQYSSESIWNQYGTYGGEYSSLSPFSRYTSTPPTLLKGGKVIGRLTVNKSLKGAVNPHIAKSCDF